MEILNGINAMTDVATAINEYKRRKDLGKLQTVHPSINKLLCFEIVLTWLPTTLNCKGIYDLKLFLEKNRTCIC